MFVHWYNLFGWNRLFLMYSFFVKSKCACSIRPSIFCLFYSGWLGKQNCLPQCLGYHDYISFILRVVVAGHISTIIKSSRRLFAWFQSGSEGVTKNKVKSHYILLPCIKLNCDLLRCIWEIFWCTYNFVDKNYYINIIAIYSIHHSRSIIKSF